MDFINEWKSLALNFDFSLNIECETIWDIRTKIKKGVKYILLKETFAGFNSFVCQNMPYQSVFSR